MAARLSSGWAGRTLTEGVDSGAAEAVVPASQFLEYPLEPNVMSASGKVYYTADGGMFSKDRSFAYHPKSKETIEFTRRNKVYEFDIEVEPYVNGGAGQSGFPRLASP